MAVSAVMGTKVNFLSQSQQRIHLKTDPGVKFILGRLSHNPVLFWPRQNMTTSKCQGLALKHHILSTETKRMRNMSMQQIWKENVQKETSGGPNLGTLANTKTAVKWMLISSKSILINCGTPNDSTFNLGWFLHVVATHWMTPLSWVAAPLQRPAQKPVSRLLCCALLGNMAFKENKRMIRL